MSIKDKVFSITPRESGGPTASNRFDYQRNWAICKILELHAKPEDYLMSFEYHDDIIVFDSSSDPKKISFFQVKTQTDKKTHWTIKALLKRDKDKKGGLKNSFLGKMYDNIVKFTVEVEALYFVTNARIKGKLSNDVSCDDVPGFKCAELCNADLNTILDGLKMELSLNDLGNFKDIMFFKVGELHIKQHDQIAKGALVDFIQARFPGRLYEAVPLYQSIFDEVRRKSNVEETITDFQTLKDKKSISRDDFERHLQLVNNGSSIDTTIASIEGRLNAEKVPFNFVRAFRRYAKLFNVERMNHANRLLKTVIDGSKPIVDADTCDEATVVATLDCLVAEVRRKIAAASGVNDDYLKTILLFHLYE